ncbi:hypothetical protein ZWY2020_035856 [Hordeum vulgare]|nr:hypothetical protein ZWY2020_035856 [Hordeum vulgare]
MEAVKKQQLEAAEKLFASGDLRRAKMHVDMAVAVDRSGACPEAQRARRVKGPRRRRQQQQQCRPLRRPRRRRVALRQAHQGVPRRRQGPAQGALRRVRGRWRNLERRRCEIR